MDLRERMDRFERRLERVEAVLSVAESVLGLEPPPPPPLPRPAPSVAPDALVATTPATAPSPPVAPAVALAAASEGGLALPIAGDAVSAGAEPGADRVVASPSATRSRPAPRTAHPPRTSETATARRDLERFVGVSILGRVGVAALLLAAGYFAQWTYKQIPPLARVASIYGLAVLLIGTGAFVRRRTSGLFVGILWGGGVAAAYLAGVVARIRYDLVSPAVAVGMLAAACVVGEVLARRLKVQALALVAIVGAAAAPLIVGGRTDERTSLLVYLMVVHAWGAWVAARNGWPAARFAALGATFVTALTWFQAHGATDVSTQLHVHLYLVGWTAPEWLRAVRGRPAPSALSVGAPIVVLVLEILLLVVARGAGPEALWRWGGLVAGATWLAIAAAARSATREAGSTVSALARTGGVLFVLGSLAVAWPDRARDGNVLALTLVATAGLLALAGRRWFRVGDGIALLSAILGIATVRLALEPTVAVRAVVLIVPVALLLVGRAVPWRTWGFLTAGFGAFLALWPVATGSWTVTLGGSDELARAIPPDSWARVLPFGVFALLVAGTALRSVRRDDRRLLAVAAVGLTIASAITMLWSLRVSWGTVTTAIANPATTTAVILFAAASALLAVGRRSLDASMRTMIGATLLGIAATTLWREVHAATGAISPIDLARATETLAFVGAASMLLVAGRRDRVLSGIGGIAFLALTTVHVAVTVAMPGGAWTAAIQLVALVGCACLLLARSARAFEIVAGALVLASTTVIWLVASVRGRFEALDLLVNGRFVSGVVLVTALVLARSRAAAAGRTALSAVFAVGAPVLSAFVALPEVLEATRSLGDPAMARALVSVYGALHAAVVLAIGFRRDDVLLRWTGIAFLALTMLHAAGTVARPGSDWTAAIPLVAVAACAATIVARSARVLELAAGTAVLMGTTLLWVAALSGARFGTVDLLVNGRFVSGAVLVALLAYARARATPVVGAPVSTLIAVVATLLSVAVAVPEVLEAAAGLDNPATRRALVSVYGALHAAAVLAIGFRRRDALLRWMALGGFGVVVGKVGLYDLADASTPIRVLVTGALGAVLLACAYAYARRARGPSGDVVPDVEDDSPPPAVQS